MSAAFWNGILGDHARSATIAQGVTKTVTRTNPHTGMAYAVSQSSVPFALDADECPECDGDGRIWNNADPASGQWVACECATPKQESAS